MEPTYQGTVWNTLEIDKSLMHIFKDIEKEKKEKIFGIKNWFSRCLKSVNRSAQDAKLQLIGTVVASVLLPIANSYLIMGAYGNFVTADYQNSTNMGTLGHIPEWLFESVVNIAIVWKLFDRLQMPIKHNELHEIYKAHLNGSALVLEQRERLNNLRIKDLKQYRSSNEPFLLMNESIIKDEKDLEKGVEEKPLL